MHTGGLGEGGREEGRVGREGGREKGRERREGGREGREVKIQGEKKHVVVWIGIGQARLGGEGDGLQGCKRIVLRCKTCVL